MDREIHIDRRRSERSADNDSSEAVTIPAGPLPQPPGMTARTTPPGMTPARGAQARTPPPPVSPAAWSGTAASTPAPVPQRTPGLPVMPPRSPSPGLPGAAPLPYAARDEDSIPVDIDEEAPAPRAAPPAVKPAAMAATDGEVHARPASLWRRLLAFGVDASAIFGVVALYLLLASSVAGVQAPSTSLTGLDLFVLQVRSLQSVLIPGAILLILLSLVYCAVAAFLWNGRTLGRRLLGLRLVDTRGQAPAPGRAVVRALLASVSFGFFLAGFWMALFDRRGQTLHDKLTSTYVVQPS
ncbi:RDD family protein [Cystobacter ferrugineus]|uniref:RDD family protein n=1 Tax=Cystobacter ferrugineus TaxID=83449 RepID=A0A1L9BKS2_9BACT|nr:RDD family protein [Cystobacter ferrugineus]